MPKIFNALSFYAIRQIVQLTAIITISSLVFMHCASPLPSGDIDNGGIFLPDGFEALVVVDSLEGSAYTYAP